MVTVVWSNGKRDSAPTWATLLDDVRASQGRPLTDAQFRRELRTRAIIWSGFRIDETLPADKLFRELEWAKLVKIESAKEEVS